MARFARVARAWMVVGLLLAWPGAVDAQESPAAHDVNSLAKASQNPVGDLISLPFRSASASRRRRCSTAVP